MNFDTEKFRTSLVGLFKEAMLKKIAMVKIAETVIRRNKNKKNNYRNK